jgi:hypothetical protein
VSPGKKPLRQAVTTNNFIDEFLAIWHAVWCEGSGGKPKMAVVNYIKLSRIVNPAYINP